MPVRKINLALDVIYIFNGRDFFINSNLPLADYNKVLSLCQRNDREADPSPGRFRNPEEACEEVCEEGNISDI